MRSVRSRRSLVLSAILTGLLLSLLTQSAGAARGTTIKAVVVKSWSDCGSGGVIWDDLNANWSQYGSVPISIDYSNTQLCNGPVTYDALVASGADVVIISDAAGGGQEYSQSEIEAVKQYADAGHNVIATYVTFFFGTDNRGLAPIFGIRKATTYLANEQAVTPTYDLRWPSSPLFRDVPDPYQSSGYPFSQVPSDGAWSNNEVHVGDLTGRTSDSRAIILVHTVMDSARIYISNMPEYGGGTQDKQFFYNAIIYPSAG